jgi:hypothetical protein
MASGRRNVQFAEIFCRELASALHTLDLLLVERQTTAERSIEAVNHAVSIPVDDILLATTSLLERWIGHDDEMAETLKTILSKARCIKENILRVGEEVAHRSSRLREAIRARACAASTSACSSWTTMSASARALTASSAGWAALSKTARDGKEAITLARLSRYDTMLARHSAS